MSQTLNPIAELQFPDSGIIDRPELYIPTNSVLF